MDIEKLINGAVLGALIGVGLTATTNTASRIRQKHLTGYDNLDMDGAGLGFQLQVDFGEDRTKSILRRMNQLAGLAAVIETASDTDTAVLTATAERAHHIHDRIIHHVNDLRSTSVDTDNNNSETAMKALAEVQDWAQIHASNIDAVVRQRCGFTQPPVPCEYASAAEEGAQPCPEATKKPPQQPSGMMGMLGNMMSLMGMFGNK